MPKGGKRDGAGRPVGSGKYKESTVRIRVPQSKLDEVQSAVESTYGLPLFGTRVSAGFPSPADEHMEGPLNLNTYLIPRPASTFFVRVSGDSMIDAGIKPDDLLVVDRSLFPKEKDIVIAVVDTELTVKRFSKRPDGIYLLPENKKYSPLKISLESEFSIWGVVTAVISCLR